MFAAPWKRLFGLDSQTPGKLGLKPDTFLLLMIALLIIPHDCRRLPDATQEAKLSTAYLSLSQSILVHIEDLVLAGSTRRNFSLLLLLLLYHQQSHQIHFLSASRIAPTLSSLPSTASPSLFLFCP